MSSEVKRYVVDMQGRGKECVLASDSDALHAEAEALRAENARLQNVLLEVTARRFAESWKKRTSDAELEQYLSAGIAQLEAERDALRAELAITRRVIDRIGQLSTTPHESKERFIRRVQSVIEWQTAAQQDQPK